MHRLFLPSILAGLLLFWAPAGRAALLVDPAGGTPFATDLNDDDQVYSGRPLGFPFSFFGGDPQTTVDVATNGNLNFSRDPEFKNTSMPSADTARISPLWDDLEVMPLLGDSIVEKVEPGVWYSVTWKAHSRLNALSRHVFQVVIFGQATRIGKLSFRANDIVFAYEGLGPTFDKGSATVGLDAGEGSTFVTVPDLAAGGGDAKSSYAPALLNLGGGLLLFRPTDDGSYALPNLTNHLPVAVPDAGYGPDPVTIAVLANDTDPDGDQPLLDSVTQGAFGAVTANPDGTVTYTPGAHFAGTDSFTYNMIDGLGGSAMGTVSIMPFAAANGAYDGSLFPPPDDPDAPALTVADESGHVRLVVKDGGAFQGTILYPDTAPIVFQGQFNGAGKFAADVQTDPEDPTATTKVALGLEFLNGVNRITGTVDDGALVLVAPRSINSPPEAHDDIVYLNGSKSLVMKVLDNDVDRDGDLLTIKSCTQAQAGDVTISADRRTLTYVPFKSGGADRLSYTVMDPSGLTSTAQVTVLAYSNARGVYDGLISGTDPDGGVVVDNTGRLRLSVAATGAFTASISYGGWPFAVRGTFNSAGDFSGTLKLPEDVVLTLKLHLDLTEDSHQVTGTISDADGNVLSQIAVGRSRFRVRTFPAPQAGVYAVLPPVDDQSDAPGLGWARLFVNAAGGATLLGKFGDGTSLGLTGQVQMDGTVPFFVARRAKGTKRTGFITGTLAFADPATKSDLTGRLTLWSPPSDDFSVDEVMAGMDVVGAVYLPPRVGQPILTLPATPDNAQLDFVDFVVPLSIGIGNTDANKMVILQPKTGLFTGSFWEDADSAGPVSRLLRPVAGVKQVKRTFTGMILRQQNRGAGVIVRSDGAVRITLGPVPAPSGQ
ncbi:MAG TPA: Ig-like domain-containing protein [Chthoniobacteraceae bacterium]|jgi:hypothetical protein|nr:Ig-like domain-containing protein [Chthoniobacteraceae bacterium]